MDKIKHPGLIGFAVFVSFLASACNIGAFASPYWYYESTNGGTGYGGFWQACIEMSGSKTCSSIKPWEEGKECMLLFFFYIDDHLLLIMFNLK